MAFLLFFGELNRVRSPIPACSRSARALGIKRNSSDPWRVASALCTVVAIAGSAREAQAAAIRIFFIYYRWLKIIRTEIYYILYGDGQKEPWYQYQIPEHDIYNYNLIYACKQN